MSQSKNKEVQEMHGLSRKNPLKALRIKATKEQEEYREWLKMHPPANILFMAQEYVIREDILYALNEMELSYEQARYLLKLPKPITGILKVYQNIETDHMDVIRGCITSCANSVSQSADNPIIYLE